MTADSYTRTRYNIETIARFPRELRFRVAQGFLRTFYAQLKEACDQFSMLCTEEASKPQTSPNPNCCRCCTREREKANAVSEGRTQNTVQHEQDGEPPVVYVPVQADIITCSGTLPGGCRKACCFDIRVARAVELSSGCVGGEGEQEGGGMKRSRALAGIISLLVI